MRLIKENWMKTRKERDEWEEGVELQELYLQWALNSIKDTSHDA